MNFLRKLPFLFATFVASVVMMAAQKPLFMARYAVQSAEAGGADVWFDVLWHGLSLDMTVAGYITALPILVVLASLWIRLPDRPWRTIFNIYFALVSVVAAAIFAVDLALYEYWGFRLDSSILIYLSDPKEAMASVDPATGFTQTLIFLLSAGVMWWIYSRVVRLFDGEPLPHRLRAVAASVAMLLLAGFDFLAIRGGIYASVANVSKVAFSPNVFLNHAAINPVFSFLATLGENDDYASEYPFFDEAARLEKFAEVRGNGRESDTERILTVERPNVVLVILESFARTFMDEKVDGEWVMPNMQRLKGEGVWFENFFANSFRTDRGEVAILSGFPAQTRISMMKLPAKNRSLPSLARSLGREGYQTLFAYGGDLNFTDQASYMYATGWQELVWQKDLTFDTALSSWGWDDAQMCPWFADKVIEMAADNDSRPFLAGLLTLSSHEPFEVPYHKFDDKILNAMAFTDDCVGRMIDSLKASPAWDNLLVVMVADHAYPYPQSLKYYEPVRHRIPMIWTGGAVSTPPRTMEEYGSQIDICASVLAQLGYSHEDFDFSKDIFSSSAPKFGYWVFNNGFGVIDSEGEATWDCTLDKALSNTKPELLDVGRVMLQSTYVDISKR